MGSETSKQTTNKKHIRNTSLIACNGYIRSIENQLDSQLIPASIYYLCYQFYHHCNRLIYLSQDNQSNPSNILAAELNENNKLIQTYGIQCNLINDTNINHQLQWDIVNAGIHYQSHIALNNKMYQQLSTNHNVNDFDVIFKVGGKVSSSQTPSASAMAVMLDPIHKTQGTLSYFIHILFTHFPHTQTTAYCLQLPSLPSPTCGNFALFSNKYGLISIGGEVHDPQNGTSALCDTISNLSFDEYTNTKDWQWNTQQFMKLNQAKYQPV